jgi:hypothetical protein
MFRNGIVQNKPIKKMIKKTTIKRIMTKFIIKNKCLGVKLKKKFNQENDSKQKINKN